MKVETFLFGSIEVNPEQLIEFPQGLCGLEEFKKFVLVHESEDGDPASFTLQSVEDPAVALQIIDPHALGFSYELALDDEEVKCIELDEPNHLAVMLVLLKPEDAADKAINANLRAPLLINTRSRRAMQKVLTKVRPNVLISSLSSVA